MAEAATTENVQEKVFDAIAELGPERDQISRDSTFDSLDVDSLDLVEVGQMIEEEFGVEIKGEDVEKLNTVGEVIDLVVERAQQ